MKKLVLSALLTIGSSWAGALTHQQMADDIADQLANSGAKVAHFCVKIADDQRCYGYKDYPEYFRQPNLIEMLWLGGVDVNKIRYSDDTDIVIPRIPGEDPPPVFSQMERGIMGFLNRLLDKIPDRIETNITINHRTRINKDGVSVDHDVQIKASAE